jgi:aryl-alcohol dehydrogenase-like predicted oxidoreductase
MRHHATDQGIVPFTPEEEAEADAREASFEAARPERERHHHNAPILAAIAELDAKRLRPSAEMALAFANGVAPDPADIARLNALTAEIGVLRAGLMQ